MRGRGELRAKARYRGIMVASASRYRGIAVSRYRAGDGSFVLTRRPLLPNGGPHDKGNGGK
jgi:hypothetical protein